MSLKFQERGKTLSFGHKKEIYYIPFKKTADVPTFCPICSESMSDNLDSSAYLNVGCCRNCESDFAEKNLLLWKEGVRPSADDVESIVRQRKKLAFERYVKDVENINV